MGIDCSGQPLRYLCKKKSAFEYYYSYYYRMAVGYQKSVSVKLYPKEVEALEVIVGLAGWKGKSEALREFMNIWIEAAVVTIDTNSATKGTWQIIKSMNKLQAQMKTIQENVKQRDKSLLKEHEEKVLRDVVAGKTAPWVKVPQ